MRKLYDLTPERKAFLEKNYHQMKNTDILHHPLFEGISRACLHRWAGDLCLTRALVKNPWTEEEDRYITENTHRSLTTLVRRTGRSRFDIARRKRHLGIAKVGNDFTLTEVAIGFGCDKRTVRNWIDQGLLKAQRWEINRPDAPWRITGQAIKQFLKMKPNEVSQHTLDWIWFLDVVLNGLNIRY